MKIRCLNNDGTLGQNDKQTYIANSCNEDSTTQTLFPQQPVIPLRKSVAGVMSSTWIDPDTISLPSVSALGGGLSSEDEWDQVRVSMCHNHSHPGKLKSLA